MDSRKTLFKGALLIAVGGFLAKVIGAVYRIPLTNLLKGEGIGLYQTVFPIYCILLSLSSQGLPQSLSKLIAENSTERKEILKSAIVLFGAFGLLFSGLMAVSGGFLANLQGNINAKNCYYALAPSVFFVALISCFRGYYQGFSEMKPTAVSQIVEQVIKLGAGLSLCYLFRGNATLGASLAALAVTISEIVALVYLSTKYLRFRKEKTEKSPKTESTDGHRIKDTAQKKSSILRTYFSRILKLSLPVAFATSLMPLSHIVDSFLIVNILKVYRTDATSLYGLLSGGVSSIIGVPIALSYGVAVAVIPIISGKSDENAVFGAFKLTNIIAVPFMLFFLAFSNEIINLCYSGLSIAERTVSANLLRFCAPSVYFLAMVQTQNSIFIAKGKPSRAFFSMMIALVAKTAIEIILLKNEKINIYGGAISISVCYLVAAIFNLVYSIKEVKYTEQILPLIRIMTCAVLGVSLGLLVKIQASGAVAVLVGGVVAVAVYFIALRISGVLTETERNAFFSIFKLKRTKRMEVSE